jgi:hypothetical protein
VREMASIFKHEPTGQTIRPGKSWNEPTIDKKIEVDEDGNETEVDIETYIQHPSNWHIWSAEEKASKGIVEIVLENPPDSRFYRWSQNTDGTINKTAKDLDDVNTVDRDGNPVLDEDGKQHVTKGVKSSLKESVNSQQGSLLIQTDWMYIRKVDKAVEIPAHIQTYRDSVRVQGDAMKAAIDGATTTEEMVALFVKYTQNEDGSVTKSGILYDWPELEE